MSYTIIPAPSSLGLVAKGVDALPAALLTHGLANRLNAGIAPVVQPITGSGQIDRGTATLNSDALAAWSPRLANAVSAVLDGGEIPIILGGDCSILLGSGLALKRRGRYGLLFIDGNADFFQPAANPNGEAASMDLAFATGYGPEALTDLEGLKPYFREEDVVVFGVRDFEDQTKYGSQPLPDAMLSLDLPTITRLGIETAIGRAIERLDRPELDGIFIHLDADVLEDAIMPAVDYRIDGGLPAGHVEQLLQAAIATRRAVGLEVAIYNPSLDPAGAAGKALTDILVNGLSDRMLS